MQIMAILAYFIVMICIGLWADGGDWTTCWAGATSTRRAPVRPGASGRVRVADRSAGAVYLSGLVEAWLAIGLTAGAWVTGRWSARGCARTGGLPFHHRPSFLDNRLKGDTRGAAHDLRRDDPGVLHRLRVLRHGGRGVFFQSSFGAGYLAACF
ncbi:hypothetical protein QJS66_19140 [Kocuria rhizophila]|nr:hypothetical protein QJS66_19140 [Kocuria rhizophila]